MATRTIVLHIGPHKTGSTAIQTFCDENRSVLASNGVHYPSGHWHGQLGSCVADDPLGFVFNVHGNRTDRDRIALEDSRYLENLAREIKSTHRETVVLSYEGFFSLSAAAIERLHESIRGISDRQIVAFYCRAPVSFALSEVSQRLRMGLPSGLDGEEDLPVLAYQDKIPPFVDVFGRKNVLARHFDQTHLKNADVVDDFFSAIGHPQINRQLAPSRSGSENESISAEAALLAIEIAKRSPPPMPGNRFFTRYNRFLSGIRGARISLTSDQRVRILAASDRHSEYLKREFGIAFEGEGQIADGEQNPFKADFIESMAVQLQDVLAELERERADRIGNEQWLGARARSLEEQLHAVYASNSWSMTAPLRALRRSLSMMSSGAVNILVPLVRQALSRAARATSRE